MTQFWNFTDCDSTKRLADSPEDAQIDFEEVRCPIEPRNHFRVDKRISPLSVLLPNLKPQDVVWTWGSECLLQERVLQLLTQERFTGYRVIPVPQVQFAGGSRKPPKLWELIVNGSGGMPSPESGLRVLRVCPGCGLTDYSRVKQPSKLIDEKQWDGSDFFRLQAISGFIFVTDRVVQALRKNGITGWKAQALADMQKDLDIVIAGESTIVQ